MILQRLVENSRRAIRDGTYDIAGDAKGSSRDLFDGAPGGRPVLITEIKFASPSQGRIRMQADPAGIARRMVSGGASALSVLTQPHLFGGSPEHFAMVRQSVDVPMLMKDVVVDEVQLDAAQRLGADYILLIQSLFERGLLEGVDCFIEGAHERGLRVLLEVHTRGEFEGAVQTDADVIGINNRNLDTLEIDMSTTCRILSGGGCASPVVSESGIGAPGDIRYLRDCGASAFLVGSSIMRSSNIEESVRGMVNAY